MRGLLERNGEYPLALRGECRLEHFQLVGRGKPTALGFLGHPNIMGLLTTNGNGVNHGNSLPHPPTLNSKGLGVSLILAERADWDRLITYYEFPNAHWKHLRTINVIESPFAAVRLRTTGAKRFVETERATAIIWRLLQVAEQHFRRLNAPSLLPGVYAATPQDENDRTTNELRRRAA